jgi:hypothetical protein
MHHIGLSIVFLTSILYSYGQNSQNIGFKGGISFSTMTSKYYYEDIDKTINQKNDFKAGIYCALTVDLFKGQFLSLTTDLGFVQKGTTIKTSHDFVSKITRDHVYFSPMLKGFYDFNFFNIYALLGPRVDLDVSYATPPGSTMDGKSSRWLFGLSYGLGSEYRKDKFGILLEFQGQPDITPSVNNKQSPGTPYDLMVKQNAFILTAGFKYYY